MATQIVAYVCLSVGCISQNRNCRENGNIYTYGQEKGGTEYNANDKDDWIGNCLIALEYKVELWD